jgi:hypothetical protein
MVAALAVAAAGVGVLGATPAYAATPSVTLSLSPSSGADFSTNAATLSWTVSSACVGNEVDVFAYKGTGAWNSAAISAAEGLSGSSNTYYNFAAVPGVAATTGSTAWPNVSGYSSFSGGQSFANTAALVAAKGTGLYTLALACVNGTTFAPLTDASGNPIAGTVLVNVGATANSWAVDNAVATQIALKGAGTAGANGIVALKATVTASNGASPVGTVNFYAGDSATGTPLNSYPVTVSGGSATFTGPNGYAADVKGAQDYTAVFTPTRPTKFTPSSVTSPIDLFFEAVAIKVTATQDATTPSSIDVTAHGVGAPTSLATLIPGGGVDFIVDGKLITNQNGTHPAPFVFDSTGTATGVIPGLTAGAHTVTVVLVDGLNDKLDASVGYAVVANTANVTTS